MPTDPDIPPGEDGWDYSGHSENYDVITLRTGETANIEQAAEMIVDGLTEQVEFKVVVSLLSVNDDGSVSLGVVRVADVLD